MQIARRLYVYLLAGISLGALITGLTMLLGVLLDRLGVGPGGDVVIGGDETIRQQLTVAAALVAVSLPVWLIHWFVAERSVRPERPGSAIELNSPERGLFFAVALTILLIAAATGLASLIEGAILRVAGAEQFGFRDVAGDIARTAVALGFWGYHVRLRTRDWQVRALTHQAAFLPRAYRYGAAFVGLVVLLFGIVSLVELVGRVVLDEPTPIFGGESGSWWAYPLASGVSGVVVGAAVWLGHWAHAARVMADGGWRGTSERASRLRLAAFVLVIVTTSATTLYFLGEGIKAAIEAALGLTEAQGSSQMIGGFAVPLLSAIVFALAWWIHARWLDVEPMATETSESMDTTERLKLYPVALVGLAFVAIGASWLLGLLVDGLFGSGVLAGNGLWQGQLAQFAPYAALGWGVWIWRWAAIARRGAVDPIGEAASTTRRATLLIVLAMSVLAGIGAAGLILYRIFGSLFGVMMTGNAVSELSLQIGVLLVAVVVAVGHGMLLRRDQSIRAYSEVGSSPQQAGETAVISLRLSGPSAGIKQALGALGGAVPSEYTLEVDSGPPTRP